MIFGLRQTLLNRMVSCPISYWLLCGLLVFLVINMVMIFRWSQNWWSAQVKIKHPGWSKMVENCLTECNLLDKKRGDGGCKLLKNWEKVENVKQVQMRGHFWHQAEIFDTGTASASEKYEVVHCKLGEKRGHWTSATRLTFTSLTSDLNQSKYQMGDLSEKIVTSVKHDFFKWQLVVTGCHKFVVKLWITSILNDNENAAYR